MVTVPGVVTVYLPCATCEPLTVQVTAAASLMLFDRVYEPAVKHPICVDTVSGVSRGWVGRHLPGLIVNWNGKMCEAGSSLYLVSSNFIVISWSPGAMS